MPHMSLRASGEVSPWSADDLIPGAGLRDVCLYCYPALRFSYHRELLVFRLPHSFPSSMFVTCISET